MKELDLKFDVETMFTLSTKDLSKTEQCSTVTLVVDNLSASWQAVDKLSQPGMKDSSV
jgi:hypothetical protein